jgi:hypothetical protein
MSNNGELAYLRETFPAWSIEQSEDGWVMQREGSARVLHAKTLQELSCKLRDSEISRVQQEFPGWVIRRTAGGDYVAYKGSCHAPSLAELRTKLAAR